MANLKKPKDYGLKISQPFYDAATAQDTDLIFSSSWPSMAAAFETTIDIPAGNFNFEVLHGLGFPPLTLTTIVSNGRSQRGEFPSVTKNRLHFYSSGGQRVNIKCFNVDLSVDKEYPELTGIPTRRPYDPDYGIKIAKVGKDINSTDLRDFVLHSRCQAPMILAVKTEASKVTYTRSDGVIMPDTVIYKYDRNYLTWIFGYGSFGNDNNGDPEYFFAPQSSQSYPATFYDTPNLTAYVNTFGGYPAALVVLRDPLFAPINAEVTY